MSREDKGKQHGCAQKGKGTGTVLCWCLCRPPPPRSSHAPETTGAPDAQLRWPAVNDLPVTDTFQSILLAAKFPVQ